MPSDPEVPPKTSEQEIPPPEEVAEKELTVELFDTDPWAEPVPDLTPTRPRGHQWIPHLS
jgi:hypothetical protein